MPARGEVHRWDRVFGRSGGEGGTHGGRAAVPEIICLERPAQGLRRVGRERDAGPRTGTRPRGEAERHDRAPPAPLKLDVAGAHVDRSEEHTSELQSQSNLVCRLLLEKKKTKKN